MLFAPQFNSFAQSINGAHFTLALCKELFLSLLRASILSVRRPSPRSLRLLCCLKVSATPHSSTNPPFVTSQKASAPHRGSPPTELRLLHWSMTSKSVFTGAEFALLVSGQQREPVLPNPVFMTILFMLLLPPPHCLDYYFSACPSRVGVSSFKVGLDGTELSTDLQGSQQCCKTVPLVHGELRRCHTSLFNHVK